MTIFMPTREQVQSLKVGDFALDCFGKMREVVEVYGRGDDIHGKAYVCFYTEWGLSSRISNSMKEDEILRTLPVCREYKSAEIDAMEKRMIAERMVSNASHL